MHSLPVFVALVLGLVGQAAAQVSELTMSECQTRCYGMSAEMIGCGKDDASCLCDKFKPAFWGQFTSCLIEGCAFEETALSMVHTPPSVAATSGLSPPILPWRFFGVPPHGALRTYLGHTFPF